jgi:hypothetical protein
VLPLFFRVFRIWLCLPLALLVPFAFVPELRRFDFAAVPTNVWIIIGGSLAESSPCMSLHKRLRRPTRQAAATRSRLPPSSPKFAARKPKPVSKRNASASCRVFTATTQELNDTVEKDPRRSPGVTQRLDRSPQ